MRESIATPPNKTLHTNRRPALDFGLSVRLFDAGWPSRVFVRAAVGELGRYAKRHACSVAVRSRAVRAFDHLRTRLERAAGFVCFASGRSPRGAEFGVSGQSRSIAEHFFRRSLVELPGPRKESHNKALDRIAMSAVSGVLADACVPSALMAVGQLGR